MNLGKRNKMTKPTYSTILLSIAFLTLMLTLPSTRLLAQTVEEQHSVESSKSSTRSTTEALPVEEQRSVESSTTSKSSTRSTTEAPPAEKPNCTSQCRDHYDLSMSECNQPDHPHHKKCEKWAREREKDCLDKCYRK